MTFHKYNISSSATMDIRETDSWFELAVNSEMLLHWARIQSFNIKSEYFCVTQLRFAYDLEYTICSTENYGLKIMMTLIHIELHSNIRFLFLCLSFKKRNICRNLLPLAIQMLEEISNV